MFDLTNLSAHAIIDRKNRFDFIENTIGFGEPVVRCKKDRDENGDALTTLTDTGVIVIQEEATETIITAYVASIKQAAYVYKKSKGNNKMPSQLWNVINYNNNTEWYKKNARVR